jgi:hypothetical protein
MKKVELRTLLLNPAEVRTEIVDLSDLKEGAKIVVRGMTAKEKGVFDLQFVKDGKPDLAKQRQMRERMIVACCYDEDGNKVFSIEDVVALSQQAIHIVDRLYEAADRVNSGMSVDEWEKNSAAGQNS